MITHPTIGMITKQANVIMRISPEIASPGCGSVLVYPIPASRNPTIVVERELTTLSTKEKIVPIIPGA